MSSPRSCLSPRWFLLNPHRRALQNVVKAVRAHLAVLGKGGHFRMRTVGTPWSLPANGPRMKEAQSSLATLLGVGAEGSNDTTLPPFGTWPRANRHKPLPPRRK